MSARRALLIGAQTGGLTGVGADLDAVAAFLARRGFGEVVRCDGQEATGAGMRAAMDALVQRTRPQDAVVLYYSGHGARALLPQAAARRAAGRSAYVQYLVPVDIAESTSEDFRGVLAEELSAVQRQLTAVTANVTTVLDCCHAGAMARDPRLRLRSSPGAARVALAAAAARLEQVEEVAVANPLAVRLVASEVDRSAYEGETADGVRMGLFTDALLRALEEVGERALPWRAVLRRVQELLRRRDAVQQPAVEGPAARLPFQLREAPVPVGLPTRWDGGTRRVEGGALLGLAAGDRVRLLDGAGRVLGEAEVSAAAGADVVLGPGPAAVEDGAGVHAVPLRSRLRQPVVLDVAGAAARALRAGVDASPWLRPGAAGEAALRVVGGPGGLRVHDTAGAPARVEPHPADGAGCTRVLQLLEVLAAAERFRRLGDAPAGGPPGGPGPGAVDDAVAVEVAATRADAGSAGADVVAGTVHAGDGLVVSVRNLTRHRIFVWLIDVGVSGRITLVSNDLPRGRPLEPAGRFGDGHRFGAPDGIRLGWPADVPADGPRPETLLVVAAATGADLSLLQTAPARGRGAGPPDLHGLLAGEGAGLQRGPGAGGLAVRGLDLLLDPRPRTGSRTPPAG